MDIDIYISELLFEKEVVNVPALGAFYAKKLPAQVNKNTNRLSPPNKKIVFEPKVKEFDDELEVYIAARENSSSTDASKKIKSFVRTCKEALIDGKVVVFNKIGKLSMDEKGNYIFQQNSSTNFNKEAFGMLSFNAQTFKPQETKKVIKKETKKQPKKRLKSMAVEKKKKNKTPLVIFSIIVLLLTGLLIFAFLNKDLSKKYYTKLQAMFLKEKEMYIPNSPKGALDHLYQNKVLNDTSLKDVVYLTSFVDSTLVAKQFAYQTREFYAKIPFLGSEIPKIEYKQEPKKEDSVDGKQEGKTEIQEESQSVNKRFHIIAASFEFYKNSENYCKTLKSEGYTNSRVLKNSFNGSHRVTFNSYATKKEALTELQRFRSQVKSDAWLLIQ